jgi:hypothetical protein
MRECRGSVLRQSLVCIGIIYREKSRINNTRTLRCHTDRIGSGLRGDSGGS